MRNVKDLTEGSWDSGADRAREGACRPRSIYVKDNKEKWIGYAGAEAGGRQPKVKA
jgi:hypothetical protein